MTNLSEKLSNYAAIIRDKPEVYKIGDREIEVKPITVGQMCEIQPFLVQIQLEDPVENIDDFQEVLLPQLKKYIEPIGEIFKILFDLEIKDLLMLDISNLMTIIISKLGVKDFINSITLIEKVSRNTRAEIIALEGQTFITQ